MEPIDPEIVADGWERKIYAKEQPEYKPLPCLYRRDPQGTVLTRWKPSLDEITALISGDDLYIEIWTFGHPLQPLKVGVWSDKVACVDGSTE